MAYSELVCGFTQVDNRQSNRFANNEKSINTSKFREGASTSQQTCFNGMSSVRKYYENRNFSKNTTNIILASWRDSTKKQYSTYIRKWLRFCSEKQVDTFQSTLNKCLDFLTLLYEDGLSYSAINSARSALSAFGLVFDGISFGAHPTVIRFMKGIYNLRPTVSRYSTTWDVSIVLNKLKTMSPVKYLSLKDLSLKLAMLLTLILAGRTQSLHLLSIEGIVKGTHSYTLRYSDLLKHSRPGKSISSVELRSYPPDRRLCCITVLKEYLKRTKSMRNNNTCLFISYVKPHRPVTRSTLSRWLKTLMSSAGIDIKQYTPHSIRVASVSKAKLFVSVDTILKYVGWSKASTFAKFYDKPIQTESYQTAVLR